MVVWSGFLIWFLILWRVGALFLRWGSTWIALDLKDAMVSCERAILSAISIGRGRKAELHFALKRHCNIFVIPNTVSSSAVCKHRRRASNTCHFSWKVGWCCCVWSTTHKWLYAPSTRMITPILATWILQACEICAFHSADEYKSPEPFAAAWALFFGSFGTNRFLKNTMLTKPPPNSPFLSPWFPVNSFQVDPENSKALYRRGLATKSDRPDEAEKDFMKAWQVRVDKRDDDG